MADSDTTTVISVLVMTTTFTARHEWTPAELLPLGSRRALGRVAMLCSLKGQDAGSSIGARRKLVYREFPSTTLFGGFASKVESGGVNFAQSLRARRPRDRDVRFA
jgi:hypothetical protein